MLMICNIPSEMQSTIPEPGEQILVFPDAELDLRKRPEGKVTESESYFITQRVIDELDLADHQAKLASFRSRRTQNGPPEESIDDEEYEKVLLNNGIAAMKKFDTLIDEDILNNGGLPSNESKKHAMAERCFHGCYFNDIGLSSSEHQSRVREFVKRAQMKPLYPVIRPPGIPWEGVRLNQPVYISTEMIFLKVTVPPQPDWPMDFRKVPLRTRMKMLDPGNGDLRTVVKMATKEAVNVARMKYTQTSLPSELKAKPFTAWKHQLPDTALEAWHCRNLSFDTLPNSCYRDLTQFAPGLETYSPIITPYQEKLRNARAGIILINGNPGTGKTHLAFSIARAVIQKGVVPSAGWKEDPDTCSSEEDNPSYYTVNIFPKTKTTPTPQTHKKALGLWTAPQHEQCDDACNRFAKARIDFARVYNIEREVDNLLRTKSPVVEQIRIRDLVHKEIYDYVNTSMESRTTRSSPVHHPRSLSNAVRRLIDAKPANFPNFIKWRNSLDGYHGKDDIREARSMARQLLFSFAKKKSILVGTSHALHSFVKKYNRDHRDPLKVHFIVQDEAARLSEPMTFMLPSVCPEAVIFMVGDPVQFGPMSPVRDFTTRQNHNERSIFQYRDIYGEQRAMSLMERLVNNGYSDINLHINHRSMGDSAEWVKQHIYPRMRFMNVTNSLVLDTRWYMFNIKKEVTQNAVFVDVQSKHMEVGTSCVNGANAFLCCQVAHHIYMVRKAPSTQDWLAAAHHVSAPLPVLASPDALSSPDSYAPPAIHIARVLIITPYKQQVSVIKNSLQQWPKAIMPIVEVRTIDSCPSHEADFVILDMTKSEGYKFMNDRARLAVACSRHRQAFFVVGNKMNMAASGGLLSTLVESMKGSEFTLPERPYCATCLSYGHLKNDCRQVFRCSVCISMEKPDTNHTLMKCPTVSAFQPSYLLKDAKYPSDGCVRNPFLLD